MKEYLFPIVQETAGRTIVINDVPETMTVDNILAIINKTQGKPVIGPLNMGDITDFDFDDGTMTITLSESLPALAAGDKLLVKCFTTTESGGGGELEPATDAEYAVFKSHIATEIANILTPITEEE